MIRQVYVLELLLFLAGGIMATVSLGQTNARIDLNAYKWKNRVLLLFAPSEADGAYSDMRRELEGQGEGIVDRDLLVFHILEDGESRLGDSSIDQQSPAFLRERFSVKPGRFAVVLIGKDGGEKLRREEGVALAEIFSLIDSMPMRRREMRERGRR